MRAYIFIFLTFKRIHIQLKLAMQKKEFVYQWLIDLKKFFFFFILLSVHIKYIELLINKIKKNLIFLVQIN